MLKRVLLLSAAPLTLQACFIGTYCTLAGCGWEEVAVFDFAERHRDWQAEQGAQYVFTVSFDGEDHVCSGELSDASQVSCDSDLVEAWSFTTSGEVEAAYSGVDALVISTFPSTAQLEITRDGEVVFSDDFTIEATTHYPNGERCEPECVYWSAEVSW